MTDEMLWTLIGGFLTILTVMGGLVLRVVQTEVRGVRQEVTALRELTDVRFNAVDQRLARLDADVQALVNRAMGQ